MGITFAVLKVFGKIELEILKLKIWVSIGAVIWADNLRNFALKPSDPVDLMTSRCFKRLWTYSSVINRIEKYLLLSLFLFNGLFILESG